MTASTSASSPVARLRLDPAFTVAPVNRRIFGSFVEHLGRCVYTGIFEPEHPTADTAGFRTDVAELITELGPTIVRYPGGNFVSAYRWEDGVGPVDERPVRYDLAWRTVETNRVGTDEFLQWCERLDLEPMMAVNLGTRGVEAAVELVQYCNGSEPLTLARQRAAHGRAEPYGVSHWCLGNEMDGPWQMGFKTPEEYGRLAEETARALKRYDPSLQLVACGSSGRSMPTFGTWERVVLERCFDLVEMISAHAYYEPVDGDHDSFLASAEDMDRFIAGVVATADHVAAARRSDKRIMISFDEWNVWFAERRRAAAAAGGDTDEVGDDVFDAQEAVVVGSLLIELLRHTDRVAVACQAQLVNLLAPILTREGGPAWRQTIFHPFALTARHARGVVLRGAVDTPVVETAAYGEVGQLHSVATFDDGRDGGEPQLTVLAVNRSRTTALPLRVELTAFGRSWRIADDLRLAEDDPHAVNTETDPDRVVPRVGDARIDGDVVTVELPPCSWHCVRLIASP